MSANAPLLIKLACNYCSEFFDPREFVRIGESVLMCWKCYEKHTKVVDSWAEPPQECGMCKTSFADLAALTPGQPVSMFPHWKDGIYQFLCRSCDEKYVLQRADLFGNTRHGYERKLK